MRKTANRKLTAEISIKPPRRRGLATTPHSSRLQVQRNVFKVGARTVEMRMRPEAVLHVLAPDTEQPPGTPNTPVSRQAAAVSVAPGCLTS